MKENEKESKLKKFIKDAFTSEAKASRIPYYFFAICILLTVICLELNTANRYLKRIASGGLGTYNYETNTKANDPYEVFSDKTSEQSDETSSDGKSNVTKSDPASETQNRTDATSDNSAESKPQGKATTYVINKSSKKIHYPNCSYASNMKEENKLTVNLTADELKNQYLSNGYVFCSRCAG